MLRRIAVLLPLLLAAACQVQLPSPFASLLPPQLPLQLEIPDGYRGYVVLQYALASCAVLPRRDGHTVIRFADETVLGFQRSELKRIRLTPSGADITLGEQPRTLTVLEKDVVAFGPDPVGARAWLGRLAHGRGEAWIRMRDGRELRFAVGDGPHVSFRDPAEPRTS